MQREWDQAHSITLLEEVLDNLIQVTMCKKLIGTDNLQQ